jgi:hypothetical protein
MSFSAHQLYCRELSAKQDKLTSLQASFLRAAEMGRHEYAHHFLNFLHEEMLWSCIQVANCVTEMAYHTFDTIEEGKYLLEEALHLYQYAYLERRVLSPNRRKAIGAQIMLLMTIFGHDDHVVRMMVRQSSNLSLDRYALVSGQQFSSVLVNLTAPLIFFALKAKIFGLARTLKPKLELFLQTPAGHMIDETKSEIAAYLYGYGEERIRNQATQVSLVGSILNLRNALGHVLVKVLLDPQRKFCKQEWPIIFSSEVPGVFWSVLKRFFLEHPEVHGTLEVMAELLLEENGTL